MGHVFLFNSREETDSCELGEISADKLDFVSFYEVPRILFGEYVWFLR